VILVLTIGTHPPRQVEFEGQDEALAFLDGVLVACDVTGNGLHVEFIPALS